MLGTPFMAALGMIINFERMTISIKQSDNVRFDLPMSLGAHARSLNGITADGQAPSDPDRVLDWQRPMEMHFHWQQLEDMLDQWDDERGVEAFRKVVVDHGIDIGVIRPNKDH